MSPTLNEHFSFADVVYYWRCVKCGYEEAARHRHGPGHPLFQPSVPDGWKQFEAGFVCPSHKIVVLLDGEVAEWE